MRLKNVIIFIIIISSSMFWISNCLAGYELIGIIENNSEAFCPFFSLGDINNNGYDDFAIKRAVGQIGYVDIFLGGEEPEFVPYVTLSGDTLSLGYITGGFGSDIASGDLNNDGCLDVIISAARYSTRYDDSYEGKVYIFYGGAEMDTIPDVVLFNNRLGERFGDQMACDDLNNDGIDDWVVYCRGSYTYNRFPRFYIYYGGEDYEADLFWDEEYYAEDFRQMQVGDINGDGYSDVLNWIPVPEEIRVRFGSEEMDTTIDMFIRRPEGFGGSGDKFEIVGDINGDGYLDLFVNFSTYINDNFSRPFYYGGPAIDTLYDYICQQPGFSSSHVEGLGDINIDGYDDFKFFGNTIDYIYYGGDPPDSFYSEFLEAPPPYVIGQGTVNIGDINNSSFDEILISGSNPDTQENFVFVFSIERTSIIESNQIPSNLYINLNSYPNPFNSSTTINFKSTQGGDIELKIFNLLGGLVKSYSIENHPAGEGNIFWDGTDVNSVGVPSGVYFIKLNCAEKTAVKKITYLK